MEGLCTTVILTTIGLYSHNCYFNYYIGLYSHNEIGFGADSFDVGIPMRIQLLWISLRPKNRMDSLDPIPGILPISD
jgi:hypothetical protein